MGNLFPVCGSDIVPIYNQVEQVFFFYKRASGTFGK